VLTREAFERQAAWPQERVHGWAPGNYFCTCGDCGIHYVGDKRSVQCYPCAAKFVPPPRPETIEEIRADRDALRAELDRAKGEMERVRRNHLRRMLRQAQLAARSFAHIAKQGGLSSNPQPPKRLRRAARNRVRFATLADALAAALFRTDAALERKADA
jgi:hypothetical protein